MHADVLLPMLLDYAVNTDQSDYRWAADIFIDNHVPFESLLTVLENIFFNNEVVWKGQRRRYIGNTMLYSIEKWKNANRGGGMSFGDGENALQALEATRALIDDGCLSQSDSERAQVLAATVERTLREGR